MKPIKTIGHSNHPIKRFVDLLTAGGVDVLVDVRSTPWSRRFPQFGKERLAKALAESSIEYLHEGAALGGKPEGGGSYNDLAARPAFREALDRLAARAGASTLCLMCAEKEPLDCHRTVLVSRRLAERGVAVEHLLADGRVRPHAEIEETLLGKAAGPDLFDDRATRLARAWAARERAMRQPRAI
ncbi:MAG: DUF488 domain-containing protein [Reyranella sp.]|nr:DUF488 domain-containing protein [Reyranella sp.]